MAERGADRFAVAVRIGTRLSSREDAFRAIGGHQERSNWKTDRRWEGLRKGLPVIAAASGRGQGLFLIGELLDNVRGDAAEDVRWGYRHAVRWQPEVHAARIEGVIARIVAARELLWLTEPEYREALDALTSNPSATAKVSVERRLLALRPDSSR